MGKRQLERICLSEYLASYMSRSPIPLPKQEVERLYNLGLSVHSIGKTLGVCGETIHRFMQRCGMKLRRPGELGHYWKEDHHNWKGDKAGYLALHHRVMRLKGKPKSCEVCGTTDPSKTYEWANLSGKYELIEDYKRMCRKCHRGYDKARRHRE